MARLERNAPTDASAGGFERATTEKITKTTMLRIISDVSEPLFRSAVKQSWILAPAVEGPPSKRLISSTEAHTPPWIVHLHNIQPPNQPLHEVACYQLRDAIVSGEGQVWIGRNLVAAPQIMPLYVNHILQVEAGGAESLMRHRDQPVRSVSAPCLVAAGHGPQVYGHFLIEVLFRILTAKLAMASGLPRHKVLIDKDAPDWFVDILRDHLDIDHADLEFFEPARECVHLENALVPTRVLQEPGFHPLAKDLVNALVRKLAGVVWTGRIKSACSATRRSSSARRDRGCTTPSSLRPAAGWARSAS